MKTIALKGESRTDLGKSATKAVRAAGQVPCVLYGNGENTHFSIYESGQSLLPDYSVFGKNQRHYTWNY